jgi:hypothetical protein
MGHLYRDGRGKCRGLGGIDGHLGGIIGHHRASLAPVSDSNRGRTCSVENRRGQDGRHFNRGAVAATMCGILEPGQIQ